MAIKCEIAHTQWFFLESEEHSVYELDVLEVIVDHVVEFQTLQEA